MSLDNELWNDIYDTYIVDKHNLGTRDYFKSVNPAAIEEITAVMMETARKRNVWTATDEQLSRWPNFTYVKLKVYQPSCSGICM